MKKIMKRFLFSILAIVAIATTARAQTKYDLWVGGVQVTSTNASNIKGGDIKSGTVKYDASKEELTLENVTIERSGSDKQGIYNNHSTFVRVVLKGNNTITTKNSCAVRCGRGCTTTLEIEPGSMTTLTELEEEAIWLAGDYAGISFVDNSGKGSGKLVVNSPKEYAVEGKTGKEEVNFFNANVTLNGAKGSLVNLGEVSFVNNRKGLTCVTLKATGDSRYPQVQNVASWVEDGYTHIDAPVVIGTFPKHPVFNSSQKTITKPDGLSRDITSYDIVINENAVPLNYSTFPDNNFRTYVKTLYNNNENGYPEREYFPFYSKAMVKEVKQIDVYNKNIQQLNGIEYFTELTQLTCGANKLTSLDVSKNTALTYLDCSGNSLTSLDVSKNTALTQQLYCYDNQIKGDKMQALVESLPTATNGKFYVINTKSSNEKNVITKAQVTIAKNKGWKVYDINGGLYKEYSGSNDTPTGITAVGDGELTLDSWYSIDGKKLQGEPAAKGIYIKNGKKVVK